MFVGWFYINNGDKFFEERFKEIQEAYEILTNEEKRKGYDYKRYANDNSGKFNKQEYEEYTRKKEREFEKQKNTYKKWEESLKRKEEDLKSKAKSKNFNKKISYSLIVIGIICISVLLFYKLSKSSSSFDNDVRKMADLQCRVQKLEAKDPADLKAKKDLADLEKEMEAYGNKMEEKYKDKKDDKEMEAQAQAIITEVMDKCK